MKAAMERARRLIGKLSAAIQTIFGLPNYEAYLEWHATFHPGEAPLSRRAFYDRHLKDRYGRGGLRRCC
jgi:uncharacterized short protein YbdD (DUF466 family)